MGALEINAADIQQDSRYIPAALIKAAGIIDFLY